MSATRAAGEEGFKWQHIATRERAMEGGRRMSDGAQTVHEPCAPQRCGYNSHAQCITAVHDFARKKCIFERAAHGLLPFRAKYGVGPNHDYAMRRCVRRYTGF